MNDKTKKPQAIGLRTAATLTLGAAIIGAGSAFAVASYSRPAHDELFVTFDTVRYTNARSAAAVALIGEDARKAPEAVTTLARVDKGVVPAIREAAGGRLVIVRQALVLDGSLPDITDTVLESLGLPLDTPTIAPQLSIEPATRYSQSPLYKFAEKFVREENERARRELEREQREGFNEWLP